MLPLIVYAAAPALPAAGAMALRFTPQLMRSASILSQGVRTVGSQLGNQLGNAARLTADFTRGASNTVSNALDKNPTLVNSVSNFSAKVENTAEQFKSIAGRMANVAIGSEVAASNQSTVNPVISSKNSLSLE